MNRDKIRHGLRVRTSFNLAVVPGITVNVQYLDARRPNAAGVVEGLVIGSGGNAWWVKHDDGAEAVYARDELEPVEKEILVEKEKPAEGPQKLTPPRGSNKWKL